MTLAQITITTECNVTDTGKMCACKTGYIWNIAVCYTYRPCSNSSSFCSCLIIPDDNIPYCEIPRNISDYRVYMKGSITLNETFTTDLLDPTSVKYQEMEINITLSLLNAYTKICNPLNVSVLGFSPGSVVANYRMVVSGPLSASQLSSSNTMVKQSNPGVISSQLKTAGVSYMDSSYLEVKYWDPIQLTCQINESISNVNWFVTINNITNMIYSGGKNVNITMQDQLDKTISVLIINKADVMWEGIYTCQFFNDSLLHEAKALVNIILLPTEIIINPIQKTLTQLVTSQFVLECCVAFDGEEYNVSWTYDNITLSVQPGRRTDLKCYSLVPPSPTNDTNYTCTFTNKAGQHKESTIPVTVMKAQDKFCSIDMNYGVTWNITKAGMSATATCPSGKSGYLTRDCTADGVWLLVQDNCINQILQMALNNAQTLDDGLGSANVKVPEIIQQMTNSSGAVINNTAEVSAVVNILGTISRIASVLNNTFDSDVVTGFLSMANNITNPSYTSLWRDPNSPPASKVLQSVEQFSQLLRADNGSFEIDLENIQLKGDAYETGQVPQDYTKTFGKVGVTMLIDDQAISSLLQKGNVKITSVVFNTIGSLLPSTTEKFNDSQLNSLVQSTSIRLSDSTSASCDILMTFKTNTSDSRYSQHCVFWNFSLPGSGGAWSDVGCTVVRVEDNVTYCSCRHLTSFAILMSIKAEPLALIEEITYVGLGVSILSLCICVFVEWYVWKAVVRTNISYFRHISLVNIAMSLLCADICFLSSAFPSVITKKLICLSITFLNHFFYLALFFWTFAQSVMLLHQLLFVFHHLRKKVYVTLSFLIGYFIPAIIAAGTFLYFYPRGRYSHDQLCWLNPGSGAIYAFAIPAGSIIVFNFLTLLVVISKLSRPSVSDKNHPEDRDTAKSILKAILVLTPVFGLTWSFGFALLTDLDNLTKQIFSYGFATMNAFQGFFILLTCITERKVREVLFNKRSSSPTSTSTTTMSTSEAPSKMPASIKKKK
ncbi:adhesion G-protein coupled receptor F3-like [Anomaloglossus baeobatrachus]|uniref:adhesion G-protein coupled receptor F3-like n=1 Tax=Anomaloglossus baeobatrachus TaxID=238106 RepID=UPI003F4F3FBE